MTPLVCALMSDQILNQNVGDPQALDNQAYSVPRGVLALCHPYTVGTVFFGGAPGHDILNNTKAPLIFVGLCFSLTLGPRKIYACDSANFKWEQHVFSTVCILGALQRQAALQGASVNIADFIQFKGCLVGFLQNRRS